MYMQLYEVNTLKGCTLIQIKCTLLKEYKLSMHFIIDVKEES